MSKPVMVDPSNLPVRKLSKADVPRAVNCLAAAFAQDDVARYFTHTVHDAADWTEAQRWKLHVAVMKYIIKAHLMRGLVMGIGSTQPITGPASGKRMFKPVDPLNPSSEESFDAVALWMPPGANMDDICTILRSGLWRLNYQFTREGRKRFFNEFFPLLHETKLNVFGTPEADAKSWYLVYLGARPGARGKGLAGRLVRYVTEGICDQERRDCYLESSSKNNLKLYGRLGFEMIRTIALTRNRQGGGIEMDIMVRKPKDLESVSEREASVES